MKLTLNWTSDESGRSAGSILDATGREITYRIYHDGRNWCSVVVHGGYLDPVIQEHKRAENALQAAKALVMARVVETIFASRQWPWLASKTHDYTFCHLGPITCVIVAQELIITWLPTGHVWRYVITSNRSGRIAAKRRVRAILAGRAGNGKLEDEQARKRA